MSDLCKIEKKLKPLARCVLIGFVGLLGLSALYNFFFAGFSHVDLGLGILLTGYAVVCWKS